MARLGVERLDALDDLWLVLRVASLKFVEDVLVESIEAGAAVSLYVEGRVSHSLHHQGKHLLYESVVKLHEHEFEVMVEEVLGDHEDLSIAKYNPPQSQKLKRLHTEINKS